MVKVFRDWKARREVEVPVLDPGEAFKDYRELQKVQPSSTDLESMDAGSANLSKRLRMLKGKGNFFCFDV